MRVDIDSSEVKYSGFYRDDKCKQLEEILSDDPNYRECIVEHQHFDDENLDNDPYMVKNKEGKEILILEKWQIDALNPSELLSYIRVQLRRKQCVDLSERVAFYLLFASILWGSAFTGFEVIDYILSYPPIPYNLEMALASYPIMIVSGIIYYLKHRKSNSKKMEADLEAARSDSSFLSALRKLAAVPKSEYEFVYNDEHIERLKYIETAMVGIIS